MFSHIISTNTKPHLSGVAKFGALLAKHLDIPYVSFFDTDSLHKGIHVILSVSFNIPDMELETQVWRFFELAEEKQITFSVFFHSFDELPIEQALVKRAKKIYCANAEIYHVLKPFHASIYNMWSPPLIHNGLLEKENVLNIFSFGMAFKIQTGYHQLFAKKLRNLGINYIIRFSTGFHEKANFGKYDEIAEELEGVYGDKVQFFGFLSDQAIGHFVHKSDLFVNFFSKGARANNTTLYAVMERGCPALTNLDAYSPSWMKSGINILDIQDLNKSVLQKKRLKRLEK